MTSKDKQNKKVKTKEESRYAVELGDTVIFPEGGGQPSDIGTMETGEGQKIEVEEVVRDKLTALHLTRTPISPGTSVDLTIDWQRRFDHMQQHTGQHLLSAIFDQYELETLSWSLGETINYIELPQKVSDELIKEVEVKVNQAILDCLPITVEVPDGDGHELDLSHLPDDYDLSKGLVRIVKIGDLDRNPCCGTHLKNTAQIQSVSILHQVNVRGGNSRLHFLCGGRVSNYLSKVYGMLKNTSGNILSCQVEEVYDKVKLLNDNYREANQQKSTMMKEVAGIEAQKAYDSFKTSAVAWYYRKDGNPEAINLFHKELLTLINSNKENGISLDTHTVVMFNGVDTGMVKIMGPESTKLQQEIKKILGNIKGGGKGNSFQGKVTKYEKGEIDSLVRYLDNLEL